MENLTFRIGYNIGMKARRNASISPVSIKIAANGIDTNIARSLNANCSDAIYLVLCDYYYAERDKLNEKHKR